MHFLCLEPRKTDKNVLKFTKNLVLKFHFLLLGALQSIRRSVTLNGPVTVITGTRYFKCLSCRSQLGEIHCLDPHCQRQKRITESLAFSNICFIGNNCRYLCGSCRASWHTDSAVHDGLRWRQLRVTNIHAKEQRPHLHRLLRNSWHAVIWT